jgi:hypothetical protein
MVLTKLPNKIKLHKILVYTITPKIIKLKIIQVIFQITHIISQMVLTKLPNKIKLHKILVYIITPLIIKLNIIKLTVLLPITYHKIVVIKQIAIQLNKIILIIQIIPKITFLTKIVLIT